MERNPVFCDEKKYTLSSIEHTFICLFVCLNKTFRFTTYEYKLFVHNSVGFTPSQEVTVTTLAGCPVRGATVTASILNHTAIDVRWKRPSKKSSYAFSL